MVTATVERLKSAKVATIDLATTGLSMSTRIVTTTVIAALLESGKKALMKSCATYSHGAEPNGYQPFLLPD